LSIIKVARSFLNTAQNVCRSAVKKAKNSTLGPSPIFKPKLNGFKMGGLRVKAHPKANPGSHVKKIVFAAAGVLGTGLAIKDKGAASPAMKVSSTSPAEIDRSIDTQKLQDIINRHYMSVPANTPVGSNLVIMRPGLEAVCLNAGNLSLDAPQHWGSVSKQFTAACIAKLVHQKKIDWTDDIRKYLPGLPEFKWGSETQKVTIDDLAHMSSGLPELGIWAAFSGLDDIMLSMDARQKLLAHCPELLFKPGSQKMYCNDNYFLLAEIVEKVSGKSFADFVKEEIFSPLQMTSRCSVDPSCPKTVDGYDSNFKLDTFTGSAWGAFGIVGSPTDMVKWNDFLGRGEGNSLMSPPPNIMVPQRESVYCRGLKVAYTDDYRVVYHMGSINGFCARFMRYEHLIDPSKSFAFFLATNTNNMPLVLDAAEEVADVLAGKDARIERDELSELSPPVLPIKDSLREAKPYEGIYERPALGLQYRIDAEDDHGVPVLHFSLLHADGGSHVIVDLVPTKVEESEIVYRGPAGDSIERTSEGIVLKSPKMAPIAFKRISG